MMTLPDAVRPHAAFLRRAEAYFGLRPGSITYRLDDSTPDIAAIPARKTVLIGRRWLRSAPQSQQSKLTHELAHIGAGLHHDDAARSIGYYSNPRRDRWSKAVYADILAGTPRFDPARFGLEDAPMHRTRRRNPDYGIKFVIGRPRRSDTTRVQSILFEKGVWTPAEARTWLREHDFLYGGMEESHSYFRFRQRDPEAFVPGSFRTISLGERSRGRRNPVSPLQKALVGGLAVGIGVGIGNKTVTAALDRLPALAPAPQQQQQEGGPTVARNPIATHTPKLGQHTASCAMRGCTWKRTYQSLAEADAGLGMHLIRKHRFYGNPTYTTDRIPAEWGFDWSLVKGVVRWDSNGRVPPDDVLQNLYRQGAITAAELKRSTTARDRETAAFLRQYRAARRKTPRSPEHLAEMRAAFGSGKTIVDVITGERFHTNPAEGELVRVPSLGSTAIIREKIGGGLLESPRYKIEWDTALGTRQAIVPSKAIRTLNPPKPKHPTCPACRNPVPVRKGWRTVTCHSCGAKSRVNR